VLLFVLLSGVTVYAEYDYNPLPNPNHDLVLDNGKVLTSKQVANLTKALENFKKKYNMMAIIVTNEGYGRYEYGTADAFMSAYYICNNFPEDCIILFLDTNYKDLIFGTAGLAGDYIPYYDRVKIEEMLNSEFPNGDWYKAFERYIALCEEFIEKKIASGHLFKPGFDDPKNPLPNPNQELVFDNANLFTAEQVANLTKNIEAVIEKHGVQVLILTNVGRGDKESGSDFVDDYCTYNHFPEDVIVLFIDTTQHGDAFFYTYGEAEDHFNDFGRMNMHRIIDPDFSKGDWNIACEKYIYLCDEYIAESIAGRPYDQYRYYRTSEDYLTMVLIVLPWALGVSIIVFLIMASKMHKVRRQKSAGNYFVDFHMIQECDVFVGSHTTKINVPPQSSSRG
jgi:uncharacterized membrane protein YgcG